MHPDAGSRLVMGAVAEVARYGFEIARQQTPQHRGPSGRLFYYGAPDGVLRGWPRTHDAQHRLARVARAPLGDDPRISDRQAARIFDATWDVRSAFDAMLLAASPWDPDGGADFAWLPSILPASGRGRILPFCGRRG